MNGEPKGKLALYWAASCGGCEIAVLAIDEKILDVAALFDIVFWPVAVDAKVRDVEKMPDGSIDLCLFNGAIRTSEQEYMARLLREKSKVLVAFGSCAQEGGIPGLANLSNRREVFDTVYHHSPSTDNPRGTEPRPKTTVAAGDLHLPVFYDTVRALDQTVEVDYYLPGCPPEAHRIWEALVAVVERRLPPRGAVLSPPTTVCQECTRARQEKKIKKFYRPWQIIPDEQTCLLEQGLVCCGVATRAGCGARCPQVNSPCIGCYGPNEGVHDGGARLMAALASTVDATDPDEIDRILREGLPDVVGTCYRFSLAASPLRRAAKAPIASTPGGNGH